VSRRIALAWTLLAALLGLVQAWTGRYAMNQDGVSYIEVAQSYLRGDWHGAVNSYWGPLYSWLIAAVFAVARPSPEREFALVHALNFVIYLFALLSFRLLLREARPARIPEAVWLTLGYALFLSTTLDLITLNLVSPDLLVAALAFLAAALLLRVVRAPARWPAFAALGVALGFGYLAKSILFPFALLALAAAVFAARSARAFVAALASAALFVAVAGPFIAAISLQKGKPTFGENGRLTYLFAVNGWPYGYPHGQPGPAPPHAPRRVNADPAVYHIGAPVNGSRPIWYDTTYWYQGVGVSFSPVHQIRAALKNASVVLRVVLISQAALLVAVVILLPGSRRAWAQFRRALLEGWPLLATAVPIVVALVLVSTQPRLVAPFLALCWLAVLSALAAARPLLARRVLAACAVALAISAVYKVAAGTMAATPYRTVADRTTWTIADRDVARELRRLGVMPGDRLAYIGDSIDAYWAHLAGVRIVAETPSEDVDRFFALPSRQSVYQAMASTGAKAVVAARVWSDPEEDWRPLGATGYSIRFLDSRADEARTASR
jgi:hypothetical protein